jgi:hypothetical protein
MTGAKIIVDPQRFARSETDDEQATPGLDSEATDFRVASEFFAPLWRLQRRNLETLRLVATASAFRLGSPDGNATLNGLPARPGGQADNAATNGRARRSIGADPEVAMREKTRPRLT